jgi:hypothetical protein
MKNTSWKYKDTPRRKHGQQLGIVILPLFLAAVLGWVGCSSSTDPGGGGGGGTEPEFVFTPSARAQQIFLSDSLDFRAVVDPAGSLDVTWRRRGDIVSNTPDYRYRPQAVGPDTVSVKALSGAYDDSTYWVVQVREDPSLIPPQVPSVNAGPGPQPADVEVVWNRVPTSAFPIVAYVVAVSFAGPISEANWDAARILGTYAAVPGQVGYGKLYTESDDGMLPGQTGWFAVRAIDTFDQMSSLDYSVSHEITYPWFIEGTVSDDRDNNLLGIIVASVSPEISDNTDGTGFYRLGPFRNIDTVRVYTTSRNEDLPGEPLTSWYDFQSEPLTYEAPGQDIVLISRYVTDEICWSTNPAGLFLPFLRSMTRTDDDPLDENRSILYRWDTYPLTVYVPEVTNQDLVRMDLAVDAALEFWNIAMGEEYFVRTADAEAADLNFLFNNEQTDYGEVTLLLPSGPDIEFGRVVPQKMQVFINTVLSTPKLVTEVTLHELGHALGHVAHNPCGLADFLMFTGGGTGALDNLDPIHIDERRLVNVIRRLPQAVDMNNYRLN